MKNAIALSAEHSAFIQGNVTIYAAAAGIDRQPQVVRAAGCRVDATGAVTIFVSAVRASALLAAVRERCALATVFSQPGNHKAIQLKSHTADIVAVQRDDAVLIANYCERMGAHIAPLGFDREMLRAFFSIPVSEAVALRFTPYIAFDQTPGPNAGAAFETAA